VPARLATVIGAPALIQQESDHRHRLLRAHRERPRRRAAEQRDELAHFVPFRENLSHRVWWRRPNEYNRR
jgi:hypothetical protein